MKVYIFLLGSIIVSICISIITGLLLTFNVFEDKFVPLNALRKAIEELEKSIKDPQNKSVVEHLEVRKNELENALEKIENFE